MNGSTKIRPQHLDRQAVIYLRQSSPKQVQENQESARNQRSLQGRLLEVGWKKSQVLVIDEDQGLSGKHACGREGFQRLVADVGLRKVGIIVGYEVSRLSRNCADWHRLLELCSLFDTLIGDSDGIYHPRDFNDRLLLGLKGTMSEAELHSLRLRLDAGRLSKAKRGALIQHLPTGYIRDGDGAVQLDPDQGVRDRIRLVFQKFQELGSVPKVLTFLVRNSLKLPRHQTSGLYAGEIFWKDASAAALLSILKNPAYAGAFVYGRRIADPTRQVPGRPATGRIRKPRSEWLALVPNAYPSYISWAEHEKIQQKIAENAQRMQEQLVRRQGLRRGEALLSGMVRCGVCGRHMQVGYKEGRFQYSCFSTRTSFGKRSCQYVVGKAVDELVVQEFLRALDPAHINVMEKIQADQAAHHAELLLQLQKDVTRLQYEANRAERQYNAVEPENRLTAATLERKWEAALEEWEHAKKRLAETSQAQPEQKPIRPALRQAFVDVGRRLPDLWSTLTVQAQKALLRTLITSVHLLRLPDARLRIRIVWRGGAVSEHHLRVRAVTLRDSDIEATIVERIRHLSAEGRDNEQIAKQLNDENLFPCRGPMFSPIIIGKIRRRHKIISNRQRVQGGQLTDAYTTREVAGILQVDPSWFSRQITKGRISIKTNERFHCYLFPKDDDLIRRFQDLRLGKCVQVTVPEVHFDG